MRSTLWQAGHSSPPVVADVRFSLAYSVLGLVAAETVKADKGLGFLITQGQTCLQTNQVFGGRHRFLPTP